MSPALIAELDAKLHETSKLLQPTPTDLFAIVFLRECLLQVPVSSTFPNEWTTWCFARRSPTAIFDLHENLREIAREHEVDADRLADRLSTVCGELYYFKFKGEWSRYERYLAAKMNDEG